MKKSTALATLLLALAACDQPAPPTAPDPDPPPQPAVLTVHPQSLYFDSVGASDTLHATVLDQYGAEMSVSVAWASADPTIASVRAGVVTTRANGRVKITASVDTLSASATIAIDDPVFDDYAPDRAILERFYREADGPNWVQRAGWTDDDLPMSEWAGVTVGFDSAVGKLRPERISLVGAKCANWINCPHSGVSYDGFPLYLIGLERLRYLDLRGAWWGHVSLDTLVATYGAVRERAIPEAIMEWESLDSVHLSGSYLGSGGLPSPLCVPRAQVALTEWLHARETIRARDRPDRYQPYWKTRPCMEAADVDSVRVFVVQASELDGVLFAGRRATVAMKPVARRFTRDDLQINDSTWQKTIWQHWPTVKARWCVDGEPCVPVDLRQRTCSDGCASPVDTVGYLPGFHGEMRMCSTGYQPCRADEMTWRPGVASDTIGGAHVTHSARLILELWSKTVGDTVLLYSREVVPEVLDESRLEVTLVVQVPPTDACYDAYQPEGATVPDDCHDWPDSAYARYDSLMADEDRVWRALFQQTEHWFGTKVDIKWHDEPLLSPPHRGVVPEVSLVTRDLRILRDMQRQDDDGRYWIGVSCLVGYCSYAITLGAAEFNGRLAVSIPYGPVIAHELGHNFGLDHPDQYDSPPNYVPLAFGLWKRGDHFWEETYVDAFLSWHADTFMRSYISSDSRSEGQSITAWQFANVHAWLWGEGIAHQGPRRVIVN